MSIIEQIENDFTSAYKDKNQGVISVLRLIKAALQNAQIAKKEDLNEDEVVKILKTEAKRRNESIEAFSQAGRSELADKEKVELEIINKYLPAQLGEEEIVKKVKEIIAQSGGDNIGQVMSQVMSQLKGQADGAIVRKIVEQEINK